MTEDGRRVKNKPQSFRAQSSVLGPRSPVPSVTKQPATGKKHPLLLSSCNILTRAMLQWGVYYASDIFIGSFDLFIGFHRSLLH